MNRDPKVLKEFILVIAHQAGDILLSYFGQQLTRNIKSHADDFATEADVAAERAIITAIKAQFPNDDIIAEESGKQGNNLTGYTWIVDPLDGTFNFANNVNDFGTMIAVAKADVLQAAVVFNPHKKLLAAAAINDGVEFNGTKVLITEKHSPAELRQLLENIPETDRVQHMYLLREELNNRGWRPGRLRSAAAHALSVLEQQRDIDISLLPGKVWDFAAPALLLAESGLIVSNFIGQPYDWRRDHEGYIALTPTLRDSFFTAR